MPENQKINAVEIGKYYGNAADQTLRVVYNPAEIHPWQHFSVASTGYLADFLRKRFKSIIRYLPATNYGYGKRSLTLSAC